MLPVEKATLAPPIEHAEDLRRRLSTLREMGDELTRPDLHPLFALLVYTGVRRGKALGLRWSDVDLERRMITVRRSYDGQTKSSKQRTVPLPGALATILNAYRLADPWQGELCFPNREDEMFSRNAKVEALFHDALTEPVNENETALIRV